MTWRLLLSWKNWRTPRINLWVAVGVVLVGIGISVWDPPGVLAAVIAAVVGVACLMAGAWAVEWHYRRRHGDPT